MSQILIEIFEKSIFSSNVDFEYKNEEMSINGFTRQVQTILPYVLTPCEPDLVDLQTGEQFSRKGLDLFPPADTLLVG
jgi:hypothetical protein